MLWAVNTSTGSGQRYVETNKNTGEHASRASPITPDGLHDVYRQHAVGWRKGDLGQIYRPKYFAGGAAIHGAPKIPAYPASHGCVRVTTTFMDFVWANNLMPDGLDGVGARRLAHRGAAADPATPLPEAHLTASSAAPDGPRIERSSAVRQRPVSRSNCQPCSSQVSTQPSTLAERGQVGPAVRAVALARSSRRAGSPRPRCRRRSRGASGGASASARAMRSADSDLKKL